MTGFSRLRPPISFTALFLAFLSIATIVATPIPLERRFVAGNIVGLQTPETSGEMTEVINSLQPDHGAAPTPDSVVGSVVATIAVGTNPEGVAYDSGNGYIYAANYHSNSVISTTSEAAFNYSLSNSGPVNIVQGNSGIVRITATLTAGTAQPVTLSCSGLPSGVTCAAFGGNPVTPTSTGATSSLFIAIASSVPPSSYSFQVTGSPLGATTTPTNVTVTVLGLGTRTTSTTLFCFPSTIAVGQGASCIGIVRDTAGAGATTPTGTVIFNVTGVTGTFSPPRCILFVEYGACMVAFTATTTGSAMLTANYSGDSAHAVSSGTATLTVANLDPTVMLPSTGIPCAPLTVVISQPVTCTVYVKDTSSTGATPPTGLVDLPTQSPTGSGEATCTLSTVNSTTSTCSGVGVFLSLSSCPSPNGCLQASWYNGDPAHDGSTSDAGVFHVYARSTNTSIVCAPVPVQLDSSTTCTILVTDTGVPNLQTPTGTVNVTVTSGPGTVTGSPCAMTASGTLGTASCQLTYTPTGATTGRTDSLNATYIGDGTHYGSSITISLSVTNEASFDFSLSAPTTVTLDQGTFTLPFPIVATLTSGSPSPVTFSVTSTLPTGVEATVSTGLFMNNPCIPTCTVGVSFSANRTATIGTSTVEIQAVGGGLTRTVSISLTVLIAFDFSLSTPSPSSLTLVQGSTSQSSSITATTVSGTPTRPLGFIVTSTTLPVGVTPTYSNDPCTPNCTVTVSFSANNTAMLGTFTMTILVIGSDLGSRYAEISLTVVAPAVSMVSCGHDLSCSVQSNATLSNIRFAGITLHVEADGPPGAHGYANVTVPKTAIPNISNTHVFLDNTKLASSDVTITSNSTDYFIYFTFTFHSPVLIDIQLTAPQPAVNAATILGLDPTLFDEIIGALVAVVIIAVSAKVVLRRRGKLKSIVSSQ
jgi:hypothetical protein